MSTEFSSIIVSIVVCTLNRASLLRMCLDSLVCQNVSNNLYEVIVVDNGSADSSLEVVNWFLSNNMHFRCIKEEHLGLSFARNRGWQEARGRYVAYIDDDAIAYPEWVSCILCFIDAQPEAGIFGGPYEAFYLVSKPNWFPPEYGSLCLGEQERPIKLGTEWINGSNMVIKKDLFCLYGGFDVRLGMIGGKAAYGEEVNFFLSMRDNGVKIFYVPSIRVKHLVAEYKMSLKWLLLSDYSVGRQYELTFNVKRSLVSHLLSLTVAFCSSILILLRPVFLPFKRRVYYAFHRLFYEFGAVIEHSASYFKRDLN